MAGANHHFRRAFVATAGEESLVLSPALSSLASVDGELDVLELPWASIICVLPPDDDDLDEDGNPIYTLLYAPADPASLKEVPITSPPQSLLGRYLFSSRPLHLDPSSSDIVVLVSTTSGGGSAVSYNNNVVQPLFRLLSIEAETEETTSPTSIRDFITARSSLPRPQTIVLLSGDTGIFDAINAPSQSPDASNITLAVFPLGTGNAFASSVHLSRGFSPLAALLFGNPHTIPTFRARFAPGSQWVLSGDPVPPEGVIGAVVVSWGFHAALVADSESLRGAGVGVERFKLAAQKNLEPVHEYRGRLSILPPNGEWRAIQSHIGVADDVAPEKEEEQLVEDGDGRPGHVAIGRGDPHFYALATMCSNLEEAFRISPSSKLGERVIRVVHFPPMEGSEVMNLMGGAYHGGTHVDDDRVGYEVAKGVRIDMAEEDENWRRVCVDGATVMLPRDGWVECTVMEEDAEDVEIKALWID